MTSRSSRTNPGSRRNPDSILYATVTELANAYRSRKLSPLEVVRAHLTRIQQLNDKMHAYITVTADTALREARRAERAMQKRERRGSLNGIPFAVKDQVTTKGIRTTAGSVILRDWVPEVDATAVARLRNAGAILLGKLNMTEFAAGPALRYPFGTPRNPWNLAHETGASSSGPASALAAGMATLALGEDTGGSIRQPAAYCGVVGLRPTWGLVSRNGMIPLVWQVDTLGPMARTVEDVAQMLQAIAGHDPSDPTTSQAPVPSYTASLGHSVKGIRAGVVRDLLSGEGIDPETAQAVRNALIVLQTLGVSCDEVSLSLARHAGVIYLAFGEAEAAVGHLRYLRECADQYGDTARVRMAMGLLVPAFIARWAERVGRAAIQREVLELFERYDILLAPTAPSAAPPIATEAVRAVTLKSKEEFVHDLARTRPYGLPFALAGVPALAVPCGFSISGMPLSLQIIGRPWRDDLVLRVGHAYQQATDWHTRHPQLV
jgi:aspartyl-tRNA(Asn)/glutamyl-tRNA(Gln) amidotransferase subunit A